jgi:hypothetical protein
MNLTVLRRKDNAHGVSRLAQRLRVWERVAAGVLEPHCHVHGIAIAALPSEDQCLGTPRPIKDTTGFRRAALFQNKENLHENPAQGL